MVGEDGGKKRGTITGIKKRPCKARAMDKKHTAQQGRCLSHLNMLDSRTTGTALQTTNEHDNIVFVSVQRRLCIQLLTTHGTSVARNPQEEHRI